MLLSFTGLGSFTTRKDEVVGKDSKEKLVLYIYIYGVLALLGSCLVMKMMLACTQGCINCTMFVISVKLHQTLNPKPVPSFSGLMV